MESSKGFFRGSFIKKKSLAGGWGRRIAGSFCFWQNEDISTKS